MIDADYLKILACPYCVARPVKGRSALAGGDLELRGPADAPTGVQCKDCKRTYPIDPNGFLHLLVDSGVVEGAAK